MDSIDSNFIDQMTKIIIRPHRDTYLQQKLGPSQLIVKGKLTNSRIDKQSHKYIEVNRRDLVVDCKGQKIQLSLFTPLEIDTKRPENTSHSRQQNHFQSKTKKCVIYLHANSGSRIEGLELAKYVLPYSWSMAIFDYRGSGISDGQLTSMGVNQSDDLECIMRFLSQKENIGEFSLWGRSMGAVTILYYLTKQYYANNLNGIRVRNIVLDSPFCNMHKLMYQIGKSSINLPQFVFMPIFNSINEKIKSKLGFDIIKQLDLIERIKQIKQNNLQNVKLLAKIGCLFLTSNQDKLVNHSHAQALHQSYPFSPSQLHFFNGQHNQIRTDSLKSKCTQFLCENNSRPIIEQQIFQKNYTNLSNFTVGNPQMRLPEKEQRKANRLLEERSKQSQFLLPPSNRKTDPISPKFQKKTEKKPEDFVQNTQKQHTKTSQFVTDSNSSFAQNRPQFKQNQNPTIIINNNYNVSVNVYDHRAPLQFISDIIPPINFKQQQGHGYLTDRFNDSHNFNQKLFVPNTAKVERKHSEFNQNYSSISNTSNNNLTASVHSQSYIQPKYMKSNEKDIVNNIKFEHHIIKTTPPPQYQQQQIPKQCHTINNKIEIPLIKFDDIHFNTDPSNNIIEMSASRGSFQRLNFDNQNKLKNVGSSPKHEIFLVQGPGQEAPERHKLSLAQIRKHQKMEQQRCSMKSTKIIYTKQRPQKSQFLQPHSIIKDLNFRNDESWKYKSQQYQPQIDKKKSSKDIRSMKTSLMAKRKQNDRKNSQSISNNDLKTSYLSKKYFEQKGAANNLPIHQKQTQNNKVLQYRYKIQHL